jgi:hypothetical protein
MVAGGILGAVVFGTAIGLGFLLSSRLGVAPVVPIIVAALAGAYAAWLVGVIVFGAVRDAGRSAEEERS